MRPIGLRDISERTSSFDNLVWNTGLTTGLTTARPMQALAPAPLSVARDGIDAAALIVKPGAPPPPPPIDTSRPPGAPGLHTIFPDGNDVMPRYTQTGNGCGTTSLAMILSYM